MTRRSLLASLGFVAASALNPAYFAGCVMGDDDDPGFEFDAADMAALVHTGEGTFTIAGDEVRVCPPGAACTPSSRPHRVEVQVTPADRPASAWLPAAWLGSRARACGNHTFYATASACIDSASMPVQGTLRLVRLDTEGEVEVASGPIVNGSLLVLGLRLTSAELRLPFATGELMLRSTDGIALTETSVRLAP